MRSIKATKQGHDGGETGPLKAGWAGNFAFLLPKTERPLILHEAGLHEILHRC